MNLLQARSRVMLNLTQPYMLQNKITENHVDAVLNDVYTQLASITGALRKTFDITTVANQNGYALTSQSALHIERVRYDVDDTAGTGDYGDDLDEVSPFEFDGVMEYGIPEYYWLEALRDRTNRKIYFHKIPSTADVTIRVWATVLPSELTSDSDNFEFLGYYNLALVQGATRELGAIGEGIPRLAYYSQQFEINAERIRVMISQQAPNRGYQTRYRETWE